MVRGRSRTRTTPRAGGGNWPTPRAAPSTPTTRQSTPAPRGRSNSPRGRGRSVATTGGKNGSRGVCSRSRRSSCGGSTWAAWACTTRNGGPRGCGFQRRASDTRWTSGSATRTPACLSSTPSRPHSSNSWRSGGSCGRCCRHGRGRCGCRSCSTGGPTSATAGSHPSPPSATCASNGGGSCSSRCTTREDRLHNRWSNLTNSGPRLSARPAPTTPFCRAVLGPPSSNIRARSEPQSVAAARRRFR